MTKKPPKRKLDLAKFNSLFPLPTEAAVMPTEPSEVQEPIPEPCILPEPCAVPRPCYKLRQVLCRVSITTYNILAQHLTSDLVCKDPGFAQCQHRWPLLNDKLSTFIARKDIVVLQEVDSAVLAAGLRSLFELSNYFVHVVHVRPPRYHACLIAVPKTKYMVHNWGIQHAGLMLPKSFARVNEMPWVLVSVLGCDQPFYVFGVHMPCLFDQPIKQLVHCDAVLKSCHKVSGGLPFLLAGDFNFQPGSHVYGYMTSGYIDPHFALPANWQLGTNSVYDPIGAFQILTTKVKKTNGSEFAGRLDYVFASSALNWSLECVLLDYVQEDLPSETQGSDHIPVTYMFRMHKS